MTDKLYSNAIKTIQEMMYQRGLSLSDDNSEFMMYKDAKENRSILIYKQIFSKLCSLTYNRKILNIYKQNKQNNHFILIYDTCETSSLKRLIQQNIDFVYVETFDIKSVQYNITKHCLVPLHTKTHKKFTFDISKLPKLMHTDSISKFYDFRMGDVVSIRRNECITYRIVI